VTGWNLSVIRARVDIDWVLPREGSLPTPITKRWTDEDTEKLRSLDGQTALRAAAALGRPLTTVKKRARMYGINLIGSRGSRAKVREVGGAVDW
jgi:hypothetical protein